MSLRFVPLLRKEDPWAASWISLFKELNREANTLASKASAIEMTDTAVNLRSLLSKCVNKFRTFNKTFCL